jgi:hypothetical protein
MMLIVVPSKRVDLLLRVLQRLKPMDVEALLTEAPVERLDRRVVGRFVSPAGQDLAAVRLTAEADLAQILEQLAGLDSAPQQTTLADAEAHGASVREIG